MILSHHKQPPPALSTHPSTPHTNRGAAGAEAFPSQVSVPKTRPLLASTEGLWTLLSDAPHL